jgi:hypothetical protein
MDEKLKERVGKKLKEGWIRGSMMIEALGTTERAAKVGLEQHVKKMEQEDGCIVFNTNFSGLKEVKYPHPKVEKGYSCVVETEVLTENFEKLLYVVMRYGPTSVEIHEPEKISIDFGEAQSIVNSLAEMIHNFAAAGIGGIIIRGDE